jgi:hypothetical protein
LLGEAAPAQSSSKPMTSLLSLFSKTADIAMVALIFTAFA